MKKYLHILLGALVGGVLGYVYYLQVGCVNGCTITGDPVNMSLWGMVMGGLSVDILRDFLKKKKHHEDQ